MRPWPMRRKRSPASAPCSSARRPRSSSASGTPARISTARFVCATADDGERRSGAKRDDPRDAKAIEEVHAALRHREALLQQQERRLAERQASLLRREADLETYAGKLQREGGAPSPVLPPAEAELNGNGASEEAARCRCRPSRAAVPAG